MTISSSWIIGAITLTSSADITVSGTPVTIPAGTYYLDDASAALSLLEVVLVAVTPQMTTPAIFIGRDRLVRVTAGAAFTWTAIDSRLQDALGLASIPSTSSATATAISTLLWSPGYCATTTGHPGGTTGAEHPQRTHTTSPSGLNQRVTIHGTSQVRCDLSWSQVLRARTWTEGFDDGAPGDYRRLWREVFKPGERWKWYPATVEGVGVDATAVTLPTALGPYIARGLDPEWWTRSVAHFDGYSDISLLGTVVSEITP